MAEALLPRGADLSNAPEMPPTRLPDKEKIDKYLDAVSSRAGEVDPRLASCMTCAKPILGRIAQLIGCCAPFYVWLYKWAFLIYTWLPKQATLALFGFALCFFGGTYVASIAAIEAFRQMGFAKVQEDISVVSKELAEVREANAKDDAVLAKDADGDGVIDGDQLKASELANRKIFITLGAIKQPDRLQAAIGSLWAAYIAVLATLKLEFARTTAFALGIVEVVKLPVVRILSPLVVTVLMAAPADVRLAPEATKGWSVTIIESTLTLIAVIFAWYLQMIIAAFYSGLRGGRMFADAVCQLLIDYDLMKLVPFVAQPFNPDESYLDEILGYSLAACGFCFQFFSGFQLPFPLNIIFFPLTCIEWFLKIQISMTDVGVK